MMPRVHPFLGIHSDDRARSLDIVIAVPRGIEKGSPDWPGLFWRYAYVHPIARAASSPTWLPFDRGRLTRVRHFGVRVALRGDLLTVWPPDRPSVAAHADGSPWSWSESAITTIAIGNALATATQVRQLIDLAVRAFNHEPGGRSR